MEFTMLLDDLQFIQKLGDNPNTDNGLTAAELKAWFDQAPVVIQSYINNTLIPQIAALSGHVDELQGSYDTLVIGSGFLPTAGGAMAGDIAMDGHQVTGLGPPAQGADAATKGYVDTAVGAKVSKLHAIAVLPASGWSGGSQTVDVAGVTENNTVIVGADPAYYTAYAEGNIRCTGQGAGTLTFVCEETPTANLQANVLILN